LLCSVAPAQPQQNQTQYPSELNLGKPATSQASTAVADIIKLSQAKISDDIIVQQPSRKGQRFDLSTEQLIQLKSAGVSDRVIQAMIDPPRTNTPAVQQQTASTSNVQPRETNIPAKPEPAGGVPDGANAFVPVSRVGLSNGATKLKDG
jgi:hypothetical protein